jgi:hypothetical protein
MRNEFTLTEMTGMNLPTLVKDPIFKGTHTELCISTKIRIRPKHKTLKENLDSVEVKHIPSSHYIESRFNAYSQAKHYNRPLFSEISKQAEEISDRSTSASKFRSSRYPKVPLTKELSEKVQQVNVFRESNKRSTKKENIQRPTSNLSLAHKQMKPNMILLNLKSWDRLKRESLRNTFLPGLVHEFHQEYSQGSKAFTDDLKKFQRSECLKTQENLVFLAQEGRKTRSCIRSPRNE